LHLFDETSGHRVERADAVPAGEARP